MLNSAHAFLSHIIDYAGLFPPARLPLEDALRNYLQYRRASPHAWMLGRFVCPTTRLPDVAKLVVFPQDAALLHITALGQPTAKGEDWSAQLDAELGIIQDFRSAWGRETVVDMLEFAVPSEASAAQLAALLPDVHNQLRQANLRGFLEIPAPSTMMDRGLDDTIGLKLRCGGTTAEAFPSAAQIASFIVRCRDSNLPWKATAGLHHPYGFWDASLNIWHHGFLNVFGAGLLAFCHPLGVADIEAILSDREGRHFRFDAAGFAWQDWSCPLARIADIRSRWALSFGSCSFVEPCEELRALGLINETMSLQ